MRVLTALAVGLVAFCCSGLYAEQEKGPANVQDKCGGVRWHGNNGDRCRLWRWRGPTGPMGLQGLAGKDGPVGLQGPTGDASLVAGPTGIVNETAYWESVANWGSITERDIKDNLSEVFHVSINLYEGGYQILYPGPYLPLGVATTQPPSEPQALTRNFFKGISNSFMEYLLDDPLTDVNVCTEVQVPYSALYEITFDVDFLSKSPEPFPLTLVKGDLAIYPIKAEAIQTFWFTPVALPTQPSLGPGDLDDTTYYEVVGSRKIIASVAQDQKIQLIPFVSLESIENDQIHRDRLRYRKSADTVRIKIRQIEPLPLPA